MNMRIPTDKEWNHLADVTGGDDAIMHWREISSWVDDTEHGYTGPHNRACRGYSSARNRGNYSASNRGVNLGFRPAFDNLSIGPLSSVWNDGESRVIGTLYMDGEPVKVPQHPIYDGDIQNYIPGATLEWREPLDGPAYQVRGIKAGDVVIADRVLLKNISYSDIETACATCHDMVGTFGTDPAVLSDIVYIASTAGYLEKAQRIEIRENRDIESACLDIISEARSKETIDFPAFVEQKLLERFSPKTTVYIGLDVCVAVNQQELKILHDEANVKAEFLITLLRSGRVVLGDHADIGPHRISIPDNAKQAITLANNT